MDRYLHTWGSCSRELTWLDPNMVTILDVSSDEFQSNRSQKRVGKGFQDGFFGDGR